MSGRWGGKHDLSFEQYHDIPAKWQAQAVLAEHEALNGTFDIAHAPRAASGGSGTTSYRALWYNVADGIRAGDAACAELAVRFIEEHLIVSYSGFARLRLARALKSAELSKSQRQRLSAHFLKLLESRDKCEEFSEYLKLWPAVISAADRKRVLEIASKPEPAAADFRRKLEDMLSIDSPKTK